MPATNPVLAFDYKKYQTSGLTVKQLDDAYASIMAPTTGTVAAIIAGIKLLVFFAYLSARNKLIDNELVIAKEQLQQVIAAQHDADNEDKP